MVIQENTNHHQSPIDAEHPLSHESSLWLPRWRRIQLTWLPKVSNLDFLRAAYNAQRRVWSTGQNLLGRS